ncbi:hypothetical protein FPOA_06874 [Fusarium poae]|uniref:Uncharacterized protein n=1 Tax=Fusarium poae TaxID=36050 RepID=A0A1B8AJM9_FUSPO|nr:hypothetical protein FPOA_06874 [Fusarium poae]
METASLDSSWTLSRAKGFLAGLIYIDSTRTIVSENSTTSPMFSHNASQWIILQHVHSRLEETRHMLIGAMNSISLAHPDDTLNIFINPISFYRAAVSGFHNTLLGLPPTALGDVVALCAMSHTTSCFLHNSACNYLRFDPFSDFDLWRNAINNHEHRQAFDDLVKAACLDPYLTALASTYLEPQYNGMSNEALELFWDVDLATANSFSIGLDEQPSHIVGEGTQATTASTQVPDLQSLQGSPIVSNFAHFLEHCGEFPLILAGRGATVNEWNPIGTSKPDEPRCERRFKRLYIQYLQEGDSPDNTIIQGIISVVDNFVDLGYWRCVCEVRDYLLLVSKGMFPNDQVFLDFVELIQKSMDEVKNYIRSTTGVLCHICGKFVKHEKNDSSRLFDRGAKMGKEYRT